MDVMYSMAGLAPLLCQHESRHQPMWLSRRANLPRSLDAKQEGEGLKVGLCRSLTSSTCDDSTLDDAALSDSECSVEEAAHGRLWAAGHSIGKRGGLNEDSFFIDVDALGVADGVGSMTEYSDQGMNSAAYAGEIMDLAKRSLQARGRAHDAASALHVAEEEAKSFGATTAVVAQVVGESVNIASLGDSGFLLLRKSSESFQVVSRSKEQYHEWNWPYQFTRLPPALASQVPPESIDSASDCIMYSLDVRHGDLLLLYTDGLCDNLYEREIIRLVQESVEDVAMPNPEQLAQTLAEVAETRTFVRTGRTPFADACALHGQRWSGGKQDDITVVAAWVVFDQ